MSRPSPFRAADCDVRRYMTRSASATGSDRSSTAFITLNTAVFAPMPSARVTTAVIVNPGLSISERNACLRSRSHLSSPYPTALHVKALLLAAHAAELAPCLPACLFLAQALPLQLLGFQFNVRLHFFSKIFRAAFAVEHAHASSDCTAGLASRIRPTARVSRRHSLVFCSELFAALCSQRIEARFAVVVTHSPLGGNQLLLFQPLQSYIQRSMFNEKHVF